MLDILARASRHIRSHKVKGLSCSPLQTISTTTSRASSPGTTAAHRLSACARTSPPTRSSWPDGEYTLCVQTPQTTLPLHATCVVVCTRIAAHTQHGPQRLWLQRAGRQQAAALCDTLPSDDASWGACPRRAARPASVCWGGSVGTSRQAGSAEKATTRLPKIPMLL